MEKKVKTLALVMTVVALLFTVSVKIFDVAAIGPQNTEVGFSSINGLVHKAFGVHMALYNITDFIGYLAILICFGFALFGLAQAIKRKSLFKLDRDILPLGCVYVVTLALYVLFEKLALNYRPILMPGCTEIEASFPSSHTMLVFTVLGTASIEIKKRINNSSFRTVLCLVCYLLIAFTVIGRLISGVHWLTDIFGGIFYSLALIFWFVAFAYKFED